MDVKFPPDDATPDEVLAWAEEFGVDLSMLRERLRMTPTERLERHHGMLEFVRELRNSMNSKKVEHVLRETID